MATRIEKVRAKRQALDAQAREVEEMRNSKIKHYTDAIKHLAPRLKEMMEVADEMVMNKISFGGQWLSHGIPHGDNFETNGIKHGVGFVFQYEKGWGRSLNHRLGVIGVGIEGGGCCGKSLVVSKDGDIVVNPLDKVIGTWTYDDAFHDFIGKAESFLKGFDAFESRFYDYVDNL